jgi:hypothetical protein
MLFHVTRQVQDSPGQILIGLVKSAFKKVCDWKNIRSDHVCPYGIMTCPRIDKKKGVLESFNNCGHLELTDCTNKVQGGIISDYVQVSQSKMVYEYLSRINVNFEDQFHRPTILLPTTCAWKLIDDPAPFGYRHVSFFVVADAQIAWDLSSTIFSSDIEIIGATFWEKLVKHSTSCLLWEEISSCWVTTVCPGNANQLCIG